MTTIYIHRGRNAKSTAIGRLFTTRDYNFDYRGSNLLLLLLKAWITSTEIPRADTYFLEGALCFWPAFFLKRRYPEARLIMMVPEPAFYYDPSKNRVQKLIFLWRMRQLNRMLHGVIAICEMVKAHGQHYLSCPFAIAHHFVIDPERFQRPTAPLPLNLLFICDRPQETGRVKGLDRVIQIFQIIRNLFPSTQLLLVGAGTELLNYEIPGIEYLGSQKVEHVFARATVLLAPARYDAFPIVIPESILAGVIPIVSKQVGTQELLAGICDNLILSETTLIADAAARITALFQMSFEDRQALITQLQDRARYLTRENCLREYEQAWQQLGAEHPLEG